MYPHRIRLRGPWSYELLDPEGVDASARSGTIRLPCRWDDSGLAGRVLLRRRFGWPAQLQAHERVWLTLQGAAGCAQVTLNGRALEAQGRSGEAVEFPVTELLRIRNELTVVAEAARDSGPWGEIGLEVRCSAFLRDVRFDTVTGGQEFEMRARGTLVGAEGISLELYLLLDNATVAYAVLETLPAGLEFEIVSQKIARLSPRGQAILNGAVRLELMHGGILWYAVERGADNSAG